MATAPASCVAAVLLSLVLATKAAPLISAPWGRITGRDVTGVSQTTFSAYYSIPYALPPVGVRRFNKPVAHPGLERNKLFNATTQGPACPQEDTDFTLPIPQAEDCLTLNVYVGSSPSPALRSVMVWIHGGGFVLGSAREYTPSQLVTDNDVIVVVIQYRLGILGFVASGDDVASGNYGLQDQSLAMKWVKGNIQAFGGDPSQITIFGQSAGGASVGLQLLSPYNRGMFSRAIMQSGSPLTSFTLNKDPKRSFQYLARRTGCQVNSTWTDAVYSTLWASQAQRTNNERAMQCLRALDYRQLLPYTTLLPEDGYEGFSAMNPWIPVVDGDFIPAHPEKLLSDVDYLVKNDVIERDVMSGVNNEEGAYFVQMSNNSESAEEFVRDFLKDELLYRFGAELEKDPRRLDTLINVLQFFYTKPAIVGPVDPGEIADMAEDIYFLEPVAQTMQLLSEAKKKIKKSGKASGGKIYLYLFNHYPAENADFPYNKGSYHGQDLRYSFDGMDFFNRSKFNADDFTISMTFRSFLSNFAKTGQPQLTLQAGGSWPQFTTPAESYLSLEAVPRVDQHMFSKRVALWSKLIPSLYNSTQPAPAFNYPWGPQPQPYQPTGIPFQFGTTNPMQNQQGGIPFTFQAVFQLYKPNRK